MTNEQVTPQYDFTSREIDSVRTGRKYVLEMDWMNQHAPSFETDISRADDPNIPEAARQLFEHDDWLTGLMQVTTDASRHATTVESSVQAMFAEAYAANAHPTGPDAYFQALRRQEAVTRAQESNPLRAFVHRILGRS